MPMVNVNVAGEEKLVSGAGDGIRPNVVERKKISPTPKKRVQVPSSRRFNVARETGDAVTKEKLKRAIDQLCTPRKNVFERLAAPKSLPHPTKNVTLRRQKALTVAEINPCRSKILKEQLARGVAGASPARRLQNWAANGGPGEGEGRELAGRRVYQQLLLNAWRRRRRDVQTLTESCGRLRQQVNQLEMQVDVLQKLRESESKRRSEVSTVNVSLQSKVESLERENETLRQNEDGMGKTIRNLEGELEGLTSEVGNARKQIEESALEVAAYERQLTGEKKKFEGLQAEKDAAVQKIIELNSLLNEKNSTIRSLEGHILHLKNKIELSNTKQQELQTQIGTLELKLKKESEQKDELTQRLCNEEKKMEKAKLKIIEVKHAATLLKQCKKKLVEDNEQLTEKLQEILNAAREEQEKPWWKNAGRFLMTTFQESAYLMLPALPKHFNCKNGTTCSRSNPYLRYI